MATLLETFSARQPAPVPLLSTSTAKHATQPRAINPHLFADLRNLDLTEIHTPVDSLFIGEDYYIRVHSKFLIWQAQRIDRAFTKYEDLSIPTIELLVNIGKAIEFYHRCLDASKIQPEFNATTDWKLPKPPVDIPDAAWSRSAFNCEDDTVESGQATSPERLTASVSRHNTYGQRSGGNTKSLFKNHH